MMVLYRHFDANDVLLYVGISKNEERRRKDHKGTRWFNHISKTTIVEYETEKEARQAELFAIRAESPKYNVWGKPSKRKKMKMRAIRIEDKTWEKLKELSFPENVSHLIRRILREYLNNQTRT